MPGGAEIKPSSSIDVFPLPGKAWENYGEVVSGHPLAPWFTEWQYSSRALSSPFPQFAEFLAASPLADFTFSVEVPKENPKLSPSERLQQASIIFVFEHGYSANREIWENLPALIMAFSPVPAAAVKVDLPGFGRSRYLNGSAPPEYYRLQGIEKLLQEAYQTLGINDSRKQKVVYVGHSMMPVAHALHRQEQLENGVKFVWLAPALAELKLWRRLLVYKGLGALAAAQALPVIGPYGGELLAEPLARLLGGPHTTRKVTQAHKQTARETPTRMLRRTISALGDARVLPVLQEWPPEYMDQTLVLSGGDDAFARGESTQQTLAHLGWPLQNNLLYPGAGHYFFSGNLPTPPPTLAEGLGNFKNWLITQANEDDDVARVVNIAHTIATFAANEGI